MIEIKGKYNEAKIFTDVVDSASIAQVQARPAVYTDYREMLAAGGLDGVVVACDWTAHMPVTRAALKAGFPSAWRWAAPPACLNASSWFACRRKPAFPACCWKTAVTGGRKWRFSI